MAETKDQKKSIAAAADEITKDVEQLFKKKTTIVATPDDWVKSAQHDLVELYLSDADGMALRRMVTELLSAIPDDLKKECTLKLREKFDRLKLFGELAFQEVIAVTSQKGW